MTKSINVLTVNAGSSSIKCSLYECEGPRLTEKRVIQIDAIGQGQPMLSVTDTTRPTVAKPVEANDMVAAQDRLLDELRNSLHETPLTAIGHRIVHGGPQLHTSMEVTPDILTQLQQIQSFDPEHGPAALALIERLTNQYPSAKQFISFDTGFFHDLPIEAQLLPLPRRYYNDGLRKYGFHGLSYRSILEQLKSKQTQRPHNRLVIAHLGSGASLAAIKDGKPIDTTMAFTPVSGIPMSTRSGDLDPGIVAYMSKSYNLNLEDFNTIIHTQSGLLGMSELSGNMLTLLESQGDNQLAAEAVSVFCYHVRRAIGSLTAAMGGIDTLVFTGGIGEKSAEIRERIVSGLDFLGIELDRQENNHHATAISHHMSGVSVFVLPSKESLIIAQDAVRLYAEIGG